MRIGFRRFVCMVMLAVLSVFFGSVSNAESLFVTADLSENGLDARYFQDGTPAFLKLYVCEEPLEVKMYNIPGSPPTVGVALGATDNPQRLTFCYNVFLKYEEQEAIDKNIPYLSGNPGERFGAAKRYFAETVGLPPELFFNNDLPEDVDVVYGILVWGAPDYASCKHICDCSFSIATVRPHEPLVAECGGSSSTSKCAPCSAPKKVTRAGKGQSHKRRAKNKRRRLVLHRDS